MLPYNPVRPLPLCNNMVPKLVIGVSLIRISQSHFNCMKNGHSIPTALEEQGFHVIVVEDPDHEELFKSFIQRYGHELDNRLLFYFSGHGH